MLPRALSAAPQLSKLKVYAGDVHPHQSQKPSRSRSPRSRSNTIARQGRVITERLDHQLSTESSEENRG
jgi:hypothetical protein